MGIGYDLDVFSDILIFKVKFNIKERYYEY